MACSRCAHCGLDLPWDKDVCPVRDCNRETFRVDEWDHDPEWAEKVKRMNTAHRFGEPLPDLDIKIIRKDGREYVADKLLHDHHPDLASGDILQIRGKFYEVVSAVYRDTDSMGWMIELVGSEDPTKGWPVISDEDYFDLMVRRGV